MIRTIYITTLTLLICACGAEKTKPDNLENNIQTSISFDTTNSRRTTEKITRLDSITDENNESIVASGDNINKAFVFLKNGDSTIHLTASNSLDHRIFGYASPDIKSERLLLLSAFTNDVENNPFGCKLGAYYDTGGMDEMTLKFSSTTGNFIKAIVTDKANNLTTIYFEKKWIEFD